MQKELSLLPGEWVMDATIGKHMVAMKPRTARSAERRILLVNDGTMRRILSRLQVKKDFLVLTAFSSAEAFELVKMIRFQCVVSLDLKTPQEEERKPVQLTAANPSLPGVLITSHHSGCFHGLTSGIAALPEKPLDFMKLFHTILRLLEKLIQKRRARFLGQSATFYHVHPKRIRPQKFGGLDEDQ